MTINYNTGLKFFYLYQIINWSLGVILLAKEFYKLIANNGSKELLFIFILFIFIGCFIVYINSCLILKLKKNKFKLFLTFNKWIIFIQIIQISVLGFTAYCLTGIQLGLVYSSQEKAMNLIFDIYRFDIALNYHNSSYIIISINFLPIVLFAWLDKILNDNKFQV
jgi:hypothetical protein